MASVVLKDIFLDITGKYSEDIEYNLLCWNDIEKNYSDKHRHYHNLNHLFSIYSETIKLQGFIKDYDVFIFTLFYHDIVYDPLRNDNEKLSALKFEEVISHTTFGQAQNVKEMIEATKYHEYSNEEDVNIFLDCDLLILGSSDIKYKEYMNNIRKEFHIYPDNIYAAGRIKVLEHLLSLPSIYKTYYFKQYEANAIKNITSEINYLKKTI